MLRKSGSLKVHAVNVSDRLDHLMHALAFVILQRQMRGKWVSTSAERSAG
jgi:hypothetical protein